MPVYAAECAPAVIRGALVMMWQMWTAFGIMVGNLMDIAFYHVRDTHNIKGLNWRLMLGSVGPRVQSTRSSALTRCERLACPP